MASKITFKKLPHQKHVEFLEDMEKMADLALSDALEGMIKELVRYLKKNKLAKSDDRPRGWTGEVPKIEKDFQDGFDKIINKYLKALKYILQGKSAGEDAEKAAEETDITKNSLAGMIQSAYLDSIDTQREYYDSLTGKPARTIPKDILTETMEAIDKRTARFIDESLSRLSNKIVAAVEMEAERLKIGNINEIAEGGDETKKTMSAKMVTDAIEDAGESYRSDWNRMVSMDLTLASAVGTHQAVQEIFAGSDDEVKVAVLAFKDERACQFCRDVSRNADGSFKLYSMSSFEPAGYNYGKKRGDWKLCIPGMHPNCRCNLCYIPEGFEILKDGTITPIKKMSKM